MESHSQYNPGPTTFSNLQVQGGQSGGGVSQAAQPVQRTDREMLQHNRITEIKQQAASLKGTLAHQGRCPKCTLKPPCKHFASLEALNGGPVESLPSATPDKGMFYPPKDYSSQAGTSEQSKYQRSDGFSISSHPSIQGGQSSSLLQSNGQQILLNNSSGMQQRLNAQKAYRHELQEQQSSLPDDLSVPSPADPQKKPQTLSDILAEQDALQRQLMDRIGKKDASPPPIPKYPRNSPRASSGIASITRQQMANVMKSGPGGPPLEAQTISQPQVPTPNILANNSASSFQTAKKSASQPP